MFADKQAETDGCKNITSFLRLTDVLNNIDIDVDIERLEQL